MSFKLVVPDASWPDVSYGVIPSPVCYWRLIFGGSNDLVNGLLAAEEIELRGSPGGADLTNTDTPVSSDSENLPNSFITSAFNDDGAALLWSSAVPTIYPVTVNIDFADPQTVEEIFYKPWSIAPDRSPTSIIIQSSGDRTHWVTAWEALGITGWTALGKVFTRPSL